MKLSVRNRLACAVGVVGIVLTAVVTMAAAQDTAPQQVRIASQPLAEALIQIGSQFDVVIVAPLALTDGIQSPALSGQMTAGQAVKRLLATSNLVASQTDSGAFIVSQQSATSSNSDNSPLELAPITVRGELLERDIQDTQASAVILPGETLERRGDVDLEEIVERIPGIRADQSGANRIFVIRGISQNGVGGAGTGPTITTNIDGARLSDSNIVNKTAFSTWDLEQVEILRGPQSTQSGRNALAGAVIVRSKDPTYDFEAKALGGLGRFDKREGAIALNVPVVDDRFAVRFTFDHHETGGSIDNPTLGSDEADFEERRTIRLSARLDVTEDFQTILKLSRFDDERGRGFVDRASFPDRRVIFVDVQANNDQEVDTINLRNEYAFNDRFRIASLTNYFEADTNLLVDGDITATPGATNTSLGDLNTFDQELRLFYEGDDLSAVFGGFYAKIDNDRDFANVGPGFTIVVRLLDETENTAIFGEVEYDILPQLTLVAGARYDREERSSEAIGTFPTPLTNTTYDAFLPKLGAVYRFSDDVSLGFSYQRGYRAGGSGSNAANGQPFEFDPEFTDNYELAFRSEWYERKVTFNANLFYTEWQDQQVAIGSFPDTIVTNAGESRLFGGEVDLRLRPVSGLTLFGSLAYLDTEFTDFINRGTDFSGNEFPTAPDIMGAFGAEYLFANGFFIAGDASYTASSFNDTANTEDQRDDDRFLVNARAGYDAERWRVNLYATNVFDVDYVNNVVNNTIVNVGDPRLFGVRVEAEF